MVGMEGKDRPHKGKVRENEVAEWRDAAAAFMSRVRKDDNKIRTCVRCYVSDSISHRSALSSFFFSNQSTRESFLKAHYFSSALRISKPKEKDEPAPQVSNLMWAGVYMAMRRTTENPHLTRSWGVLTRMGREKRVPRCAGGRWIGLSPPNVMERYFSWSRHFHQPHCVLLATLTLPSLESNESPRAFHDADGHSINIWSHVTSK